MGCCYRGCTDEFKPTRKGAMYCNDLHKRKEIKAKQKDEKMDNREVNYIPAFYLVRGVIG